MVFLPAHFSVCAPLVYTHEEHDWILTNFESDDIRLKFQQLVLRRIIESKMDVGGVT